MAFNLLLAIRGGEAATVLYGRACSAASGWELEALFFTLPLIYGVVTVWERCPVIITKISTL